MLALISLDRVAPLAPIQAGEPVGPLAKFAKTRSWSDAAGKFKIEASLAEADREQVRLKRADGRINVVPLAKLSEADRIFVETFLDAEAAMGGAKSSGDENPFEAIPDTRTSNARKGAGDNNSSAATNDDSESSEDANKNAATNGSGFKPLPMRKFNVKNVTPVTIDWRREFWKAAPVAPLKLPTSEDRVAEIPLKKDFWEGFQMFVRGAVPTLFAHLYRQGHSPDENYCKLGYLKLPDGEPKLLTASKTPWKILSVSPDAKTLAMVHIEGFDKGNNVSLWKITDDALEADFQFQAGGGSWDEIVWGALLPNDRLVTISQKGNMHFWDTAGKRLTSRCQVPSSAVPVIGGKGELIAIPSQGAIAFLNGQTSRQIGLVILQAITEPSIAFSPDGKYLAAYTPHSVEIIDLQDGKIKSSIPVMESMEKKPIDWVGKHVLLDNRLLIDIDLGCPVWSYNSAHGCIGHSVWAGQLFSVFSVDDHCSMVSLVLPHADAARAMETVDRENMFAIKQGSEISIVANLNGMQSNQQEEAQAGLAANLTNAGYRVVANSENVVELFLNQQDQVTDEFEIVQGRPFGGPPIPFGFGGPRGPTEKVNYRPWYHSITIKANGEEVFKKELTMRAYSGLQIKDGENAQAAVNRLVVPQVSFFKGTTFPRKLLKNDLQDGLGKSEINASGIK